MKKLYFLFGILAIFSSNQTKAQVTFSYDDAGNQVLRTSASGNRTSSSAEAPNTTLADQVGNKIQTAPVPVKTVLNVLWEQDIKDFIVKIEITAYNSFQIMDSVEIKNKSGNSYTFNMSNYPYGVYYVRFYLNDGSVYNRTITKN